MREYDTSQNVKTPRSHRLPRDYIFCFPSFAPSAPIILVSFSAKKDATYLSADTAGLPSCCSCPPSLSTCLYPPSITPFAGSKSLVEGESAVARVSSPRFLFFSFPYLSFCLLASTPRYVYVYLRISHARWSFFL